MNYSKYVAILCASPKGIAYQNLVEENWTQWLSIVEGAKWLVNRQNGWADSDIYTPRGVKVEGGIRFPNHQVAEKLYASAVWGFGMLGHTEYANYWRREACRIMNIPVAKNPQQRNVYDRLPNGQIDYMPASFRALDEWLESL